MTSMNIMVLHLEHELQKMRFILIAATWNNMVAKTLYQLNPKQNDRHFADDIRKSSILDKKCCILISPTNPKRPNDAYIRK